ncbi:succinylglutamate desuccinylase/aspartoacylase family protein [Ferrimonas aestuarii]|uniref:Succinylglutamate desuccinylase/aspartoacylase family protein n=1 Tax=Ferrimonas aestuarii TaxID=2569539 RepID=A0A4U1BT62_9GAMM|nr:succinylglutamate desuccinylase/aspartoacylase family protein [Ferrimonas aestuarii]TKB58339.1 succinylglutamate desuccinylase/aspartoacylase family protein [Ferrimonas aestuarii]
MTAEKSRATAKAVQFELAGQEIAPGDRATIDLEVAQLYTHAPLSIPVQVIHGRKPGPVLLISAAIHGDELNGVEAVRQLLALVDAKKLRGTLVAVPVVNVFGFNNKSRYLPDRRDLNRCFPGSERGSIAGRLAHQFFTQVVQRCSHIIDLHTGAVHRTNLPQLRVNMQDPESASMAQAFDVPVVVNAVTRDGSLRAVAQESGIPVITYEGGEALRYDPGAIKMAVQGCLRVMRHLGMLRSQRKVTKPMVIARSTSWVRAEQNGTFRSLVGLGEWVSKGQALAKISAPLGTVEGQIYAPKDGIVIGHQTLPLANEGDALFHLAYFKEDSADEAQQQVDDFLEDVSEMQLVEDVEFPPQSE